MSEVEIAVRIKGVDIVMITSHNINRRGFIKGAAGLRFSTRTLAARQQEPVSVQAKPWVIACRDSLLKPTTKPDIWSAMKELGVTGVEVEVNPELACPVLYKGDIDFSKVAEILRKADYREALCLENETLGKYPENRHADILKKEIALLRNLNR